MQKACEKTNTEFRLCLQEEFSRRIRVNDNYSIRSFAMHLGVHSSTLSKILSGKRALSENKIEEMCHKMGVPASTIMRTAETAPKNKQMDYHLVAADTFSAIADWHHFAILDLTLIKNFQSDVKWIADKLNISTHEAMGAIERLKRLGMLEEKNGRLVKAKKLITNTTNAEERISAAQKEYQRQIIRKALFAVDNCPDEKRDITSMVIATNSKKLIVAREKITKFRRELCNFLEDGNEDSVYHLALQLYPVTSFDNEEKK